MSSRLMPMARSRPMASIRRIWRQQSLLAQKRPDLRARPGTSAMTGYGVDYFETQKYLGSQLCQARCQTLWRTGLYLCPAARRGLRSSQPILFRQQRAQCHPDAQIFQQGRHKAGGGLDQWHDMFSPHAGVACSRTTQICSNGGGSERQSDHALSGAAGGPQPRQPAEPARSRLLRP